MPKEANTLKHSGEALIPFEPLEKEVIPLAGVRVEISLVNIPIEHIRLDKTNPRLAYKLEAMGITNPSQEQLGELLWEDNDVKDLKRSIQVNGGLIEAIIVQADGVAVEGNCRTVCYRKLCEEFPEDENWKHIRARMLPTGIGRDQLEILLGELHIAGKNEWTPFEQAAHLYKMNKRGFSEQRLAEFYRLSKSTVSSKLRAYKLMVEKYLPKYKDAALLQKWSYFEEFYKKLKPKADTPEGAKLEDDFVRWMGEGKFNKGMDIRNLPRILEDPEALDLFEREGFDAAWTRIRVDSPELESSLFKAIVAATWALRTAPLNELLDVGDGNKAKVAKLNELRAALDGFHAQAKRAEADAKESEQEW